MKLTLVLRDKKNALKLSTKTIESFMERIKTDTKDYTVGRRREQFRYTDNIESYDRQFPSHLISTQGWNKTTFCEQLLPPELSWGYTGNLQMDDKRQVLQQMAQMLLINLDEFNQISPKTQLPTRRMVSGSVLRLFSAI